MAIAGDAQPELCSCASAVCICNRGVPTARSMSPRFTFWSRDLVQYSRCVLCSATSSPRFVSRIHSRASCDRFHVSTDLISVGDLQFLCVELQAAIQFAALGWSDSNHSSSLASVVAAREDVLAEALVFLRQYFQCIHLAPVAKRARFCRQFLVRSNAPRSLHKNQHVCVLI